MKAKEVKALDEIAEKPFATKQAFKIQRNILDHKTVRFTLQHIKEARSATRRILHMCSLLTKQASNKIYICSVLPEMPFATYLYTFNQCFLNAPKLHFMINVR